MLLRELANSGIRLPEIGFGTWNYSGGVEPLRAAQPTCDGPRKYGAADPKGVLRKVAEASRRSNAQVALNWCISKENVIGIPKASTVAHVLEDIGASGWKLQPVLARLLEERMRYRRRGALEIGARRAVRWGMQMIGRWQ